MVVEPVSFSFSPNPFDNELKIKITGKSPNPEIKCEIFDIMGNKIFDLYPNNQLLINTANWKSGIYFVKINGANYNKVHKLVKP